MARGLGDRKSIAGLCVESRRTLQYAKLLVRLGVTACVVEGFGKGAQVCRSQQRLSSQLRQLGARDLRLSAQRMAQQELLEGRFRSLLLAQRLLHLALRKLETGPARRRCAGGCGQHLARRGVVSQVQQNGGFKLRLLGVEDAVGIAVCKSVKDVLGSRIVTRLVAGFGIEKICVVRQFALVASRLRQGRSRIGIALVQQVRVAQRQIGSSRGLTRVAMRVGGHRRVGLRRAHGCQLLGHWLQLF